MTFLGQNGHSRVDEVGREWPGKKRAGTSILQEIIVGHEPIK